MWKRSIKKVLVGNVSVAASNVLGGREWRDKGPCLK